MPSVLLKQNDLVACHFSKNRESLFAEKNAFMQPEWLTPINASACSNNT